MGRPVSLAAAAIPLAAATHVAAIAEQQDQNDDPPPVVVQAPAQAIVIVVAHNTYLRDFSLSIAAHTPCYDPGSFLCSPEIILVN